MSLSSTLSNALSGLTASARGANVVSSNLANVLTDGYATRGLSLSSRSAAGDGGVMVNGVTRLVDQALLQDRRSADAELGFATTLSGYHERLSVLSPDPTQGQSLTSLVAELDAALIVASSMPESETRLAAALNASKSLVNQLNDLSVGVQSLRAEAERRIDSQVSRLNSALSEVEQLNRDIISARAQGREEAGLMDQRQAVIDEISTLVPVQELQRDFGAVALVSEGGAVLLDGQAAEFTFTSSNMVAAHMTLENGLLSGVQRNGMAVSFTEGGTMFGGSLAAQFSARDELLTTVQVELDTIAQDLIERFTNIDPTLSTGTVGLFTDGGEQITSLVGLSGRIAVNAAVDPEEGGAIQRLRDGLGAGPAAAPGDARLLQSMSSALTDMRSPSAQSLGTGMRSSSMLASDFLSQAALRKTQIEQQVSFASARQGELKEMEMALGVDTDSEMQKLMLIERAYAANAKVIQAVDEMLQNLMEIG